MPEDNVELQALVGILVILKLAVLLPDSCLVMITVCLSDCYTFELILIYSYDLSLVVSGYKHRQAQHNLSL